MTLVFFMTLVCFMTFIDLVFFMSFMGFVPFHIVDEICARYGVTRIENEEHDKYEDTRRASQAAER